MSTILIPLKYSPFLADVYRNLSSLPGFALLESTDRFRGRYDILSAYPHERILITKDMPNPLVIIDELKKKIRRQDSTSALPFQGGAIGYLSYDLGAALLGIHSKPQPSLHDLPLLDLGFYDWAIIVDHRLKKAYFYAAHSHARLIEIQKEVIDLWSKTTSVCSESRLRSPFRPLISKEEYQESFFAIQKALIEGRSYQVNYTQPFHALYEGSAWNIYQNINSKNPVPFAAFLKMAHAEILSFSPERFLLGDTHKLRTSPIKGTIASSLDPVKDEVLKKQLTSCLKNQAENVMIVDLLRNDLGKISKPGSVKVSALCQLQSYNSLHHLVSEIESQGLEHMHPLDAFLSCFPGGSITGAPKLESMKIIQEQEVFARSVYCGSIGYFSQHGRFDMNIAIRTIVAKQEILHLATGGGIVIDSKVEEEYKECLTKIAAIIKHCK